MEGDFLFKRVAHVTIGIAPTDPQGAQLWKLSGQGPTGIKLTNFDCRFTIEKDLKPIPNKCKLTVFNLNEDHRSQLEQLRPAGKNVVQKIQKGKKTPDKVHELAITGIPVKIEAGYGDKLSLLWLGDLRTVNSIREGPDWLTELESGDAEKAYQNARIHVSYGPKTDLATALRAMVRALKVGDGNLSKIIDQVKIKGSTKFAHGAVLSGSVSRELDDFCRSADLTWSIQDGSIQFLDRGKALAGKALLISEDTGMLGSPTVDHDGIMTVKTLMLPDVRPGRIVVLNAARLKGNYKIEKAVWHGDTAGGEWGITMHCRSY